MKPSGEKKYWILTPAVNEREGRDFHIIDGKRYDFFIYWPYSLIRKHIKKLNIEWTRVVEIVEYAMGLWIWNEVDPLVEGLIGDVSYWVIRVVSPSVVWFSYEHRGWHYNIAFIWEDKKAAEDRYNNIRFKDWLFLAKIWVHDKRKAIIEVFENGIL